MKNPISKSAIHCVENNQTMYRCCFYFSNITIFYTLTFCKRSKSIAFTPVLSKSRFSNSERNSVTFKSQAFRGSNFSDILIKRKLYSVFKYKVFTQKSIANLLRNVFSTLLNILLIETSTVTLKMKMKPKI